MGENKVHGIKGPRHDDDVDDLGINTASGKITPGGQQQSGQGSGSQQSGQQEQGKP